MILDQTKVIQMNIADLVVYGYPLHFNEKEKHVVILANTTLLTENAENQYRVFISEKMMPLIPTSDIFGTNDISLAWNKFEELCDISDESKTQQPEDSNGQQDNTRKYAQLNSLTNTITFFAVNDKDEQEVLFESMLPHIAFVDVFSDLPDKWKADFTMYESFPEAFRAEMFFAEAKDIPEAWKAPKLKTYYFISKSVNQPSAKEISPDAPPPPENIEQKPPQPNQPQPSDQDSDQEGDKDKTPNEGEEKKKPQPKKEPLNPDESKDSSEEGDEEEKEDKEPNEDGENKSSSSSSNDNSDQDETSDEEDEPNKNDNRGNYDETIKKIANITGFGMNEVKVATTSVDKLQDWLETLDDIRNLAKEFKTVPSSKLLAKKIFEQL